MLGVWNQAKPRNGVGLEIKSNPIAGLCRSDISVVVSSKLVVVSYSSNYLCKEGRKEPKIERRESQTVGIKFLISNKF